MNKAQELAELFFTQLETHITGTLLNEMDIYTMLRLIPFGKGMIDDSHDDAIKCKLEGHDLLANAIIRDITIIENNLNSLQNAYSFAMN